MLQHFKLVGVSLPKLFLLQRTLLHPLLAKQGLLVGINSLMMDMVDFKVQQSKDHLQNTTLITRDMLQVNYIGR